MIAAAAESERQPEAGLRLSDRDPLALLGFGGIWKTEDSDASEGFCHPGPASLPSHESSSSSLSDSEATCKTCQ